MNRSSLVNPRTGLLTSVERSPQDPRMPSAWVGYGATVSRPDRFAGWRADGFGFGASLGIEAAARGAAIGEAVERYCGNAVPQALRRASWNELRAAGEDALDPLTLALYSPEQYALPGFPFEPFGRDLMVHWVRGTDLADQAPLWVPASLVYLDFVHGPRATEPKLHSLMYSGISAGTSRANAERGALEELMERDACTIWWASGASTKQLDDDGLVTGALGRPGPGSNLRIRLLEIPSDLPAPVVAAFLEDGSPEKDGVVAFGSACRSTPEAAATKALVEALGLLQLTRQLLDPAAEVWRAVEVGHIEDHVFLPYRQDRSYLDAVDLEYRTLTDLPPVAQLYLDPRMSGAPLDRLRPARSAPLAGMRRVLGEDPAGHYVRALAERGIRTVSVDVTTDDVRAAGYTVVRVIGAGLVGNAPPAFPLRGSRRYYSVPEQLGWDRVPANATELISHPIPLA